MESERGRGKKQRPTAGANLTLKVRENFGRVLKQDGLKIPDNDSREARAGLEAPRFEQRTDCDKLAALLSSLAGG